ncbi:unnamed protein product [Rotaria sp. Silwood2]|nr:unnamed protein product [Rotaria sp. Silwood2]CAF4069611.1 unnamed protein product [Rotaria sp. Silwood2]
MEANIRGSHMISSNSIYFDVISKHMDDTWVLRFISSNIRGKFVSCSCEWGYACWEPVGFYCDAFSCTPVDLIYTDIFPGLRTGCQILDYSASTLECFYNQSCVQMLIDNRLHGFEDVYQPLDLSHITALHPNETIFFGFQDPFVIFQFYAFIDQWNETADYQSYFAQCQPKICTYMIAQKLKPIAIANSILGLIGGLSVLLRLLVPSFTYIIHQIHLLYRHKIRGRNIYSSTVSLC